MKRCKACGLYINQPPVFSQQKQSHIFWVGLSAVQFNIEDEKQPLSSNTRSGALIEAIEKPFLKELTFYKTNLVKCLPLKDEKIRYPVAHEMEKCFPNFKDELRTLKPSIVFLLGKQVSSFVLGKFSKNNLAFEQSFNYDSFLIGRITYISVHHPSYILVYKRKYLENYIEKVQALIKVNNLQTKAV